MRLGALLGIVSLTAAIVNGLLTGTVISYAMKSGPAIALWRLLPHGIFELPAMSECHVYSLYGIILKRSALRFNADKRKRGLRTKNCWLFQSCCVHAV